MSDPRPGTSLQSALRRIAEAHKFLHAEVCTGSQYPCVRCPSSFTVAAALDHLDEHPRDARAARRIFHDAVCSSGCGLDSDHADRTQATSAAALRRFRASEQVAA